MLHAGDAHLAAGTRWVLALGVTGYLITAGLIQAVMSGGTRGPLLWPAAHGVPPVLLLTWLDPGPIVLLAGLALILVAGLIVGIGEHRAGWIRTAKV